MPLLCIQQHERGLQYYWRRSARGGDALNAPHQFDGGSDLAISTGIDSSVSMLAFLLSVIARRKLCNTATFSCVVAVPLSLLHLSNATSNTRDGLGRKDGKGVDKSSLSVAADMHCLKVV